MVSASMIRNCPVHPTDVTNVNVIFGPDLAGTRGKTVRTAPDRVETDYVVVPREFMKLHKYVTLVADVMFVNGIAFLVTMFRGIKFVTSEHVPTHTAKQLSKSLKRIIQLYSRGGMIVQTILMDMEFDKTVEPLMGNVVVNTSAAREHIAEIERSIRTIKERCHCVIRVLPFKFLHKLIVTNVIYFAVLWLNTFPVKSGVSAEHSPRAIVVRTNLDYKKHCRIIFGSYVEAHDKPDATNSMIPRTHECIALGPTRNFNGTHKFFCINTGLVLKRRNWTPYPMSKRVQDKVNHWGEKAKKEIYRRGLEFRNRLKEKFEWDIEDDMNILLEEDPGRHPELAANFPGEWKWRKTCWILPQQLNRKSLSTPTLLPPRQLPIVVFHIPQE
jgi:hypothetical protein